MCALVYISKRAAQTADSGTSSRRRRDEVPASQRSANVAAKRQKRDDGASISPSLHLGIVMLAPRCCRACALASPCWRLGVFALVHVGIAALRLGIAALLRALAALARRERARSILKRYFHITNI
jgi:hypothetical protein